jgi:UDP-N-acetylglucosamine--N-acetylmuramyl-(pentapeptide) pyrophosphoryl-undecaprenol N-acetylglucosamine transferase
VLPAISFGSWIHGRYPDIEVGYISGTRPVELEIYRACGIEPMTVGMEGSPLKAPGGRRLKRWLDLIRGFGRAKALIGGFKPDLCVMFGGYVSAPALIVCRIHGIRAVMHEQNAGAGRITRLARWMGVPVASGWEVCDPLGRSDYTPVGVPIRSLKITERKDAWRSLGLPGPPPKGPVAVVMTGSLGSSYMRGIVRELAQRGEFMEWTFLVNDPKGTGPARELDNVFLMPARWDIAPSYSAADVLVVRAGASTLSEVAAMGIPAVVIPWGDSAGDHQRKNASMMEALGGVSVWDEAEGRIDDLAGQLSNYKFFRRASPEDVTEKMYNVGDTVCEKLWNFSAFITEREPASKGDDSIGGN